LSTILQSSHAEFVLELLQQAQVCWFFS